MAVRVESDVEMYHFAFQPSLAPGMFPSLLFIFVVGCGRVVSCGFDASLVEWIPFTHFNKTIFSICTCAPSRCQSTAVEPTMKAPSIFQRKMLETTRRIARPHRKYRSLGTPVPRLRSLCDNRIRSLGSCFFSAPLCQDSDQCQDSDTYGT